MSIENGKLFEHCFWINWDESHPKAKWNEIEEWCAEICSGQWMIITTSSASTRYGDEGSVVTNIYSRAIHSPPTPYVNYPAAQINKQAKRLIIFENQQDAIAFKLKWSE